MHKFLQTLGFLALSSSAIACTAIADDAGEQVNEVQGGKKDAAKAHNFAVGIANKLGAVCTGTLIAPNLVLTARHCVVDPEDKKAVTCDDTFGKNTIASNLTITTEPIIRGAKKVYQVAEIQTPDEKGFCGNDIALVRLTANIPKEEAETAIPVVNFSIADKARMSGEIAALGYGITAPNAGDQGTRRLRQDIDIICVPGDDRFDCTKTIYSTMVDEKREFITKGYVCSGDSGGGAFDQTSFTSTGRPYVLGTLSRGPMNDTECLAAIYTRTDAHKDLIVNAAKKAAELGSYESDEWVKGITPAVVTPPGKTADGCEGDTCTVTDATDPAAPEAPSAETTTKTTTGCSAAPGTGASQGALVGLAFAAALVFSRRRKTRAQ